MCGTSITLSPNLSCICSWDTSSSLPQSMCAVWNTLHVRSECHDYAEHLFPFSDTLLVGLNSQTWLKSSPKVKSSLWNKVRARWTWFFAYRIRGPVMDRMNAGAMYPYFVHNLVPRIWLNPRLCIPAYGFINTWSFHDFQIITPPPSHFVENEAEKGNYPSSI